MKHIATGRLPGDQFLGDAGLEVSIHVVDLQEFLLAPGDAEICVYTEDGEAFLTKKFDVAWEQMTPYK